MTEALIRTYIQRQDHLDAYGYPEFLIPELSQTRVWVPERQKEMPILERLWYPEHYPWQRLVISHAEPRSTGIGNLCNCGVAMFIMPIGAVNAGDPHAVYQEAARFALAHNESFAVAGAVQAACAAAFARGATTDSVRQTALESARDGTGCAIRDILDSVDPQDPLDVFIAKSRNAVAPYDQRAGHISDGRPPSIKGISDVRRPSRTSSIEELPIALAALVYGSGDFHKTIRAAVFYGRDCDSIVGMAGTLFGAIHGIESIPVSLQAEVDRANRRDFGALATVFASAIRAIGEKDLCRFRARQCALG